MKKLEYNKQTVATDDVKSSPKQTLFVSTIKQHAYNKTMKPQDVHLDSYHPIYLLFLKHFYASQSPAHNLITRLSTPRPPRASTHWRQDPRTPPSINQDSN